VNAYMLVFFLGKYSKRNCGDDCEYTKISELYTKWANFMLCGLKHRYNIY
jgi:hypothetical protein